MAIEAAPSHLDPRYATGANASRIGGLVFASLAVADGQGGYQPYLARSWQRLDKTTWRFELRRDFVFHDHSPLQASDVVATYRSVIDPASASPKRGAIASLVSVQAQGPWTVDFILAWSDAAFLEGSSLGILPASLATRTDIPSEDLIGAGPYLISRIVENETVELEAFAKFAHGPPAIARIHFKIVPDQVMRALELHHGSIDLVQNAIDPDTVDWLEANSPQLIVHRGPSNSFQYLGFNFEHPALSRLEVRRAIALAVDRRSIIESLLEGQATEASGLLPPQHWAYEKEVRRYPFNPRRAGRLLDRAGLTDPDGQGPQPRLVLGYKTTTDQLRRRIAEALAAQLGRVGIKLEVLSYEWGTFYDDIKRGNFQLYSLAWVGITDPDLYRNIYHSAMLPPAGANRGRYRNRRMDRLTTKGSRSDSLNHRGDLYRRVQKHAARQLPYLPLWWPDSIVIANRRLRDFTPHPSGDLLGLARARLEPKQ
ncbi:MAG: ABC transporter substrate-binding protein [Deltaproteobacteria bacterium]